MRYWFFNGSDVVGPFSLKELTAQKGFNAASLICPEQFSDQDDHWQPARSFGDVAPMLAPEEPEEESLSFEQEMDTLLRQSSPLAFEKTHTDGPTLQLPAHPAKSGPIEEYFNHIQKEDLGELLGIPAPAENSDMDLAHALEKQLAQTSSTRREKADFADVDERTAVHLEQELAAAQETHHVATATEVFATRAAWMPNRPLSQVSTVQMPDQTAGQPAPQTTGTLPPLPADESAVVPSADTAPQQIENSVYAVDDTAPAPQILAENSVQAPAEPAEELMTKPSEEPAIAHPAQPAQVPAGKDVSYNPPTRAKRTWVFMLALVTVVGSILVLQGLRARPVPAALPSAQETQKAPKTPAAPQPAVPAPAVTPQTHQDRALEIVQNYPLSGSRGTIHHYLTQLYQPQLAQGYVARWEAEPLHKNAYLVKYQLTKTRKEPIIYIFQADVSTGKLTGALNNISLDLVGKIL